MWNRTAIACTSENKEFSEVMLDDLSEINKKLNKRDGQNKSEYLKHFQVNQNNVHDIMVKELLKPKNWKPNEDGSFPFSSEVIHRLCDETEEVLKKQSIVVRCNAPIKIFGDIHGQ
eukprot:CAMPEP_0116917278 /NCGR_PEP_ID=MMETSP0467-20121206/19042_1 /TAXON_ID=283647 /ORGANISM="Mesodinium pulex, Strain SPMC105" /LENGTH=115 /DNA_ID=CAMNT_0004594329 /DNA_START=1131 /DNA_END=1478 /DNA_ORIENTATION=-